VRGAAAAFAVYLLAALLMFALPVLDHPGREVISIGTSTDPGAFVWALRWWPHAITHGLNPFETDLLFVPDGYATLAYFGPTPDMEANARRFLREHEVDAVVLDEQLTGPWPGIMAALGARPVRAGGVLLYRVRV
jgi:hypothetical protein